MSVWYYLLCVIWNVPAAIVMFILSIYIFANWSEQFTEPVNEGKDQPREVRERRWQAGSLLITSIVLWYTPWIDFVFWLFNLGIYVFTDPYPVGKSYLW